MVAMRNSVNKVYKGDETEEAQDGRISSMSMTMSKSLQKTMKKVGQKQSQPKPYTGPHIAGFSLDKNHMPVVTNDAHSTNTNNGFTRKTNGGFFFH